MIIAILDSGISIDTMGYRNFINYVDEEKEDVWDNFGHGTMCYNVIKSIDYTASIDIVKILDKYGSCNLEILCKALSDLIDSDVNIINLSLSVSAFFYREGYNRLYNICNELYRKGKIIICAAKNNSSENTFPASFENVLGVVGICTMQEDAYCYKSCSVYQIMASDIPILTKIAKNGKAVFFKGNSKATALVTGLISKNGMEAFFTEMEENYTLSTKEFISKYLLCIGESELFITFQEEFLKLKQFIRSLSIIDKLGDEKFFYKEKICFNIDCPDLYFILVKEIEKRYHCEYYSESIRLLDFCNIYTLFFGIKRLWKKVVFEY